MSQFKAMAIFIDKDKDLSKVVQNTLFSMGYRWIGTGENLWGMNGKYIVTDSNGYMFDSIGTDGCEEINIDWMRTPKKKETIELNGKKCLKEDLTNEVGKQTVSALEEALKHLKPMG